MYLPNEIWKNIILYNSLTDARLINKAICFLCQDTFIKNMYLITKQHKLDYYNVCNTIAFYAGNIYFSKNQKLFQYCIQLSLSQCDNMNIKRLIYHHSVDLISTYNILKERDIYKKNFAKEQTLKVLEQTRSSLYTKSIDDIVRYYVWLKVNLNIAGVMMNPIQYDRNLHMVYKNENFTLYDQLKKYIDAL